MTLRHDNPRFCSRCHLPLEDPSSIEAGNGPICRAKNNHLFSLTISANIAMLTASLLSIKQEILPSEVLHRFDLLKKSIMRKAEKVMTNPDNEGNVLGGKGVDWRHDACEIDWMLSWSMDTFNKMRLIECVKYMGFIGLAGVLAGKASTGESKVWFESGMVKLLGSSNRDGWLVMRKIPGITCPRFRGQKIPYTAPAEHFEAFKAAVMEFWPIFSGDMDEISKQASEWIKAHPQTKPVVQAPAKSNLPTVSLGFRSLDFTVCFDWINGVSSMIVNKLKALVPYNRRTYDPQTHTWSIEKGYANKVETLFVETGKYEVVKNVTNQLTPTNHQGKIIYCR